MPPGYVKPYVKRNKHDAADAEAVCEAVRRPSMRFVPVKTPEQQAALVAHSVRDLLVRQRTMLVNALRGHLAEFGIVAPRGIQKVEELIAVIGDEFRCAHPFERPAAHCGCSPRSSLRSICGSPRSRPRSSPGPKRILLPGVSRLSREFGPIIAARITATVPDATVFRSGRDFAAWIGLVPRQNSTGGKARLGGISKRGNGTLRRLLVGGAMAAMFRSKVLQTDPWLRQLRARKPVMVAAVALANKIARTVWAVMRYDQDWRPARHHRPNRTSLPPCSPPSRPCRLRRWPSASLDRGCARRRQCDRSGRRNGLSVEPRNSRLRGQNELMGV